MEISYGLVNLIYFMLCSEHWRIKGSRSNKRRKLLTCFSNSLFKVYNNLSLRETGPEVYNKMPCIVLEFPSVKDAKFWLICAPEVKQHDWLGGIDIVLIPGRLASGTSYFIVLLMNLKTYPIHLLHCAL